MFGVGTGDGLASLLVSPKSLEVRRTMTVQFRIYRWLERSILVAILVSLLLSFSNGSIEFLKDISLSSEESAATFVDTLVEESQV